MPFVSKAQRAKLWKTNPKVAREFESHMTPEQIERLPERVKAKGKK